MLLLWWCPIKIQKEKLPGLQFTTTDYLSLVLTSLRIRWAIHTFKDSFRARLVGVNWSEHLPQVLLGLLVCIPPNDDLGLSLAELVLGTNLVLPGEFLDTLELPAVSLSSTVKHLLYRHKWNLATFLSSCGCCSIFLSSQSGLDVCMPQQYLQPQEPPSVGP